MEKSLLVFAAASLISSAAFASDDFATPKEAEAIVAKAVAAVTADRAAAFKEITGKDKKWVDRDLYPVVYDMNGKCLSHGQNEKQIEGITQMSEKNAQSVAHAGQAMHDLEEESRVLQAAVAQFSVEIAG